MNININGLVTISTYDNITGKKIDEYGPSQNMVVDDGISYLWKRTTTKDELNQFQLKSISFGDDYGSGSELNPESPNRGMGGDDQNVVLTFNNITFSHPKENTMRVSFTIDGTSFMNTNFPDDIDFKFTSMTLRFENGVVFAYKRFPQKSISRFITVTVDWDFIITNSEEYCNNINGIPTLSFTVNNTSPDIEYFKITPIDGLVTVDYGDGTSSVVNDTQVIFGKNYSENIPHKITISSESGFFVDTPDSIITDSSNRTTLLSIDSWNEISFTNDQQKTFAYFSNVSSLPEQPLVISTPSKLTSLFSGTHVQGDFPGVVVEGNHPDLSLPNIFKDMTLTGTFGSFIANDLENASYVFEGSNFNIDQIEIPKCKTAVKLFFNSTITSTIGFNFGSPIDTTSMFSGCSNLSTLGAMDLSMIQTADHMFKGTTTLTTIPNMDFDSATSLWSCFSDSGIKNIELSKISTPSATNISSMFSGCFNLGPVVFFSQNTATTVDGIFENCVGIEFIDIVEFTSTLSSSEIFKDCINLKYISTLSMPSSTDVFGAFKNCPILEGIDVLNTGVIENARMMFDGCSELISIPELTFSPSLTSSYHTEYMFRGCTKLSDIEGLNGLVASIDLSGTSCSIESLTKIADTVGVVTSATMTLTGIPATSDPSYSSVVSTLTSKGWTVI